MRLSTTYKTLISMALVSSCCWLDLPLYSYADQEQCLGCKQDQPAQQNIYLPKGTHLRVTLLDALSTSKGYLGQVFEARIFQPVYQQEAIVLERNSLFTGHIKQIAKASYGQNGLMEVYFDHLTLPSGMVFNIKAKAITQNSKPYFGGEGTEGMLPERVPYRNLGLFDYNRVMLRGPRAKGTELVFKPGDFMDIQLEEPLILPAKILYPKPALY